MRKFTLKQITFNRIALFATAISFGLLGYILLQRSQAATSVMDIEPETLVTAGGASVGNDSSASSGKYFKFASGGGTGEPPTGYVKAFDRANEIKDPNWFKKMYDQGFRLYVLHTTWWEDTTPNMTPKCTPWPGAKQHIKWALDAGIKVGAYTRDPRCWKGGIEAAGEYQNQLQFFDIDIEDDPGVKVTREMIDGIKAMGVRPIIYSGYGMWENVMGKNATQFADVPLWDTNVKWEGGDKWEDIKKVWVPNTLDPKPIQYGGWNTSTNMRVAIQQSFDTVIEGEAVDINTFNASFLK